MYFHILVFLSNILFSQAFSIVNLQYIIHMTYKICVNQLFVSGKVSSKQ